MPMVKEGGHPKLPEHIQALKEFSLLYVEDDDAVRDSLLRFLQRRFDRIHTAINGKEGLALFEMHRPDIVLTDIQMPVMDGLEMSRRIKAQDPNVPIVITTAFSEISYLSRSLEIGISRYVKKPIAKEELIDCCGALTGSRRFSPY